MTWETQRGSPYDGSRIPSTIGKGAGPSYDDRMEEIDADDRQTDAEADFDSNVLHAAAGSTCPHCGKPIEAGQAVRRMVSGEYEHDSC